MPQLSPLYRGDYWGTERASDSSKVTQGWDSTGGLSASTGDIFTPQSAPSFAKGVLEVVADTGRRQMRRHFANSEERSTLVAPRWGLWSSHRQEITPVGAPQGHRHYTLLHPQFLLAPFPVAALPEGPGRNPHSKGTQSNRHLHLGLGAWRLTPQQPIWRNHS